MDRKNIIWIIGILIVLFYVGSTNSQSTVMPSTITTLSSCNEFRDSKINSDYSVCSECFLADSSFINCAANLNIDYSQYKDKYLFFYQNSKSETCGDISKSTLAVAKTCKSSEIVTDTITKTITLPNGNTFTCTRDECIVISITQDIANNPEGNLCKNGFPYNLPLKLKYNEALKNCFNDNTAKIITYTYEGLQDQGNLEPIACCQKGTSYYSTSFSSCASNGGHSVASSYCGSTNNICSETDSGKDTGKKGTTKLGTQSFTDYCLSSNSVKEYYCDLTQGIKSQTIDCNSNQICSNGACVLKSSNPSEDTCEQFYQDPENSCKTYLWVIWAGIAIALIFVLMIINKKR